MFSGFLHGINILTTNCGCIRILWEIQISRFWTLDVWTQPQFILHDSLVSLQYWHIQLERCNVDHGWCGTQWLRLRNDFRSESGLKERREQTVQSFSMFWVKKLPLYYVCYIHCIAWMPNSRSVPPQYIPCHKQRPHWDARLHAYILYRSCFHSQPLHLQLGVQHEMHELHWSLYSMCVLSVCSHCPVLYQARKHHLQWHHSGSMWTHDW